jgi:hypothetical protein
MTPNAFPFARIHAPSPAELDRCIRGHQPVVFTGMMAGQPASRWDLPELTERLGKRPVAVVRQTAPRVNWDPQRGLPLQDMPFSSFVDQAFRQGEAGISYLQDDINSFPTLRQDYRLPEIIERKGIFRAKFWLSGPGPITPLHYDPVETLHWLIRGHKRFLLFPPGTGRYYPHPARSTAPFISRVDPDHLDAVRFPRFRAETGRPLVLEAGEVLYLPSFWWHQVYSQGATNLSLNFVWGVSRLRSARHFGQYIRSLAHLRRAAAKARAKAAAAAQEMM